MMQPAPVHPDAYRDLKARIDAAPSAEDVARIRAELPGVALTERQRAVLDALLESREEELFAAKKIVAVEPPAGEPATAGASTELAKPRDRGDELKAELADKLAKGHLAAVKYQLARGLLDEKGNLVKLDPAKEAVVIGLCVTYGLEPAIPGHISLMDNEPYIESKGWKKIVSEHPLFREYSKPEWLEHDDANLRYEVLLGLRRKDPLHPDDPSRDVWFWAHGHADSGNVTAMIAMPREKGKWGDPAAKPKIDAQGKPSRGFVMDMAVNRAIRELGEQAFPLKIDWSKVNEVLAKGGPHTQEREQERTKAPAEGAEVIVVEEPPAGGSADEGRATEEQVAKIKEFAKSSKPALQMLKKGYQDKHGTFPEDWPRATASRFIDDALAILNRKEEPLPKTAAERAADAARKSQLPVS